MCYIAGSVEQAVNICPMCRVFPHPKCPHTRDLCRNHTAHRQDILFLTNAEVDSFNGCGYCKWARANNHSKAPVHNPGWPGCCRPPAANEHRLIPAADWRSVSIVHHISIPPDIKAALEAIPSSPKSPSLSPSRSQPVKSPTSSPTKSTAHPLPKSPKVNIPSKPRSGGSPQMANSPLSPSTRSVSGSALSSSAPYPSTLDQHIHRRSQPTDPSDKQSASPHSSPRRKVVDLDSPLTPRRNSATRSSSASASTSSESRSPSGVPSDRRRSPPASQSSQSSAKPSPSSTSRLTEQVSTLSISRPKKDLDQESVASGSSGSGSSMTDGTVTSDGGFTDYLSDESEAELQRLAEERAVLEAQYQAEEMEFKAARQQLAQVDLRPPKSWNPHHSRTSDVPTSSAPARVAASSA